MSSSIEYRLSATPEPYESAPMPEGLTSEQYKVFTEERAAMEEKYEEAIGAHDMWKTAKAKEAWLEKLKVDKEARAEKLKILQKEEEERKAAEEKRKEEERQAAILKEQQDAAEKKKKDDLKKEKEEKEAAKRLRKEQRKAEKAAKAVESGKGKGAEKNGKRRRPRFLLWRRTKRGNGLPSPPVWWRRAMGRVGLALARG
ncbi:hypothetical protein EV421DRAFT_1739271 [Armillaria borealis]|uniref:Uncharacterized protein n=1 Tax=Armillaria borealis TaxID=47425 RepID=A0AA39J6K1_9AGAR|nr:hypothetical protein EV421DRAFT_1739271 [Armillaria borealis]